MSWTRKKSTQQLFEAVKKGNIEEAKKALENSADLFTVNRYGNSPVMVAVKSISMAEINSRSTSTLHDMLDFLIEQGADVNLKNQSGISPLLEAVKHGDTKALKKLVASGRVDLDTRDKDGNNAMMFLLIESSFVASSEKFVPMCKILLDAGMNINAVNNRNETVLMLSIVKDIRDMVRFLIESGADINIPDKNGNTPLINALAWRGNQILADFLIKSGADVFARNHKKRTMLAETLKSKSVYAFIFAAERIGIRDEDIPDIVSVLQEQRLANIPGGISETLACAAAIFYEHECCQLDGFLPKVIDDNFLYTIRAGIEGSMDVFNRKLVNTLLANQRLKLDISGDNAKYFSAVLLNEFETNPENVLNIITYNMVGSMDKWIADGVEGADILVYRLSSLLQKNGVKVAFTDDDGSGKSDVNDIILF